MANFIQKAIKHPGALRAELHAPAGKDIPAHKLHVAAHSKNAKEAARARLALELRSFAKK